MHAFSQFIESGDARVVAHPDLIEVSTAPCDTGSPLDTLRNEFPQIQFPEELFPDSWPRQANSIPVKENTVYEDTPGALSLRADQIRRYVKNLDDTEIILVTHGGFTHFLLDDWAGDPGSSRSYGTQLDNGEALPVTLPGKSLPEVGFQLTGTWAHIGPRYPNDGAMEDCSPEVYIHGRRDCGVFTPDSLRL
jgi:broad specificity phosphatase PhoE